MRTATSLTLLFSGLLYSQVPNPTQQGVAPAPETGQPVYRVTVVSRTIPAVNYRHRSGATKVDLRGTALMPHAHGDAKIRSKSGRMEIDTEVDELLPPSTYGPEYMTYVLWAVTPEGRANNLGEYVRNGDNSELKVTTDLQAFALMVTAEPYFAVTQPSDVVVMENILRHDTEGAFESLNAKYELLPRGFYTAAPTRPVSVPMIERGDVPFYLLQARNALNIASAWGAGRLAADSFGRAQQLMQQAEDYQARKSGDKAVSMMAREAVQTAEDSRLIAFRRERELEAENQRRSAEQARLNAEQESQRRTQAEADRQAAERAKAEAEQARAAAEQARAAAEQARVQALVQQQAAQNEAERARREAAEAEQARQAAEADKGRMREQLREQLNSILETRETARGLIVSLSDVLFDTGKYTLRPGAREKLAKISGILMSHAGLRVEVEGHTDNVGGEEFNQRLSDNRAATVRDYLVAQGVPATSITSRGLGESSPVATNATPEGRQQNRRVELVVSGESITTGTSAGPAGVR
jgi:outer membrane protein OmpA-like peptidoglycan-associated protein